MIIDRNNSCTGGILVYKSLFSPITVGSLTLKNRIFYPALSLYAGDALITERHREFLRERAAGGAAAVNIGPTGFCPEGNSDVAFNLSSDSIESFAELAAVIKEEGASPWLQLFHAGAYSKCLSVNGTAPIAPSAVYSNISKTTPVGMSADQIAETVELFAATAQLAKDAGFEGIEISASAGYLISEFLSPLTNLREDSYGGSFENRTRFPVEIIKKIKDRLGQSFPLSMRMAGNDFVPESNTSEDIPRIAAAYEKAGADILSITGGWHQTAVPQLSAALPAAGYSYLALNIKKEVSIPVIASNRIRTPLEADTLIKEGIADMVNLGRVLIADPLWPQKAESGNEQAIRKCIACNQGCTDNLFSSQPVQCILNARAGLETERHIKKIRNKRRVMVVGGGPAGMEAALRASEAGHFVTLLEESSRLGGQLNIASVPPDKGDIKDIIDYYTSMLSESSVDVLTESKVTTAAIRKESPDLIIMATGAKERKPDIEGLKNSNVFYSWQILNEDPPVGRNIAVIGGGSVGIETAHFLASKGTLSPEALHFLFTREAESVENLRKLCFSGTSRVTIFEMSGKAGSGIGKSTKWAILSDLDKLGVTIKTDRNIMSVEDGKVQYMHDGQIVEEQFDTIVIAAGSVPRIDAERTIRESGIPYVKIGDCDGGSNIGDAVHSAYLAVMNIGKPVPAGR